MTFICHFCILSLQIFLKYHIMSRYRNVIASCVLMLTSSFAAQAQLPDSVYCYLKENFTKVGRKYYPSTELLIYNSNNDTIIIPNFNKNIHHVSSTYNRDAFYWDLLTISNNKPEYDDVITVWDLIVKEEKKLLLIPPDSLFVSYIRI